MVASPDAMARNKRIDCCANTNNFNIYKIIIVTLLYETMLLLAVLSAEIPNIIEFGGCLPYNLPVVSLTFCMYIMMDHNESAYETFLKVLWRSRLYWIGCCCCRHMVLQQVNQMNTEKIRDDLDAENENEDAGNERKRATITKQTVYDVDLHDIKPDHGRIEFKRGRSEFETIDDDCNRSI